MATIYRASRRSIEMNARKVLEMGGGTLLVSLPKEWARRNGVEKGDTLDVSEFSGRGLIVRPVEDMEDKPKEFVVGYPGEDFAQVANDVTGAYLLGYDTIKIEGERRISREDREKLKETIGRLIGLEIMEEDSKKMTLQFLIEPSAIVPEKTVRRMSGILDGMLRDAAEALAEGDQKLMAMVSERDDEVDRLYFLLVRATRAAVTRPDVTQRYGLSPVDLLDYRVLASFLESIGDAVSEFSRKLQASKIPRHLLAEYASCALELCEMNELATQAFISRRAGRPRSINSKVSAMAQDVAEKLAVSASAQAGQGATVAEILGTLLRVSRLLVDVSDLAVIAQPVFE